jgi:hypothetical protein
VSLGVPLRCHCHRERERRLNQVDPIAAALHLRLVWPQWHGAGTESVSWLAPEFPFDVARRGYSVGTKVLRAALPEYDVPTAFETYESAPSRRRKAGMPSCLSMSRASWRPFQFSSSSAMPVRSWRASRPAKYAAWTAPR